MDASWEIIKKAIINLLKLFKKTLKFHYTMYSESRSLNDGHVKAHEWAVFVLVFLPHENPFLIEVPTLWPWLLWGGGVIIRGK